MSRALLALAGSAVGQQAGDNRDVHLPMPIWGCTTSGGCHKEDTTVTLDANWRWMHNAGGSDQCYGAKGWNPQYCPDEETCSNNCALEGIDEAGWQTNYGVTPVKNGLKLKYVPGSRMYLLDSASTYKMFSLKNKEFAIDVDVSNMPCGVNGALYFSEMERDGGKASSNGMNKAGAEYGTGYCDAQCPRDINFIGGYANLNQEYGSCCSEFDIWEANGAATAYTAHPCNVDGPERVKCHGKSTRRRRSTPAAEHCCSWATSGQAQACGDSTAYCMANADQCSDCGGHWVQKPAALEDEFEEDLEVEAGKLAPCDGGKCDQAGCDFNPYRNGVRGFYGPGAQFELDSTKPFTVKTTFITDDGTDYGNVVEVRRTYVQNGKNIHNPKASFQGLSSYDSLKDDTCAEQKTFFNRSGTNDFRSMGGMTQMGHSLGRGMVLALSIWDDAADNMQWLDGWEPENVKVPNNPGADRGPCARDSGDPKETRRANPDAYVTYSNIRYGDIGSTHAGHLTPRRRRRSTKMERPVAEVAV